MIKYFRSFRQKLLSENKFSKYLIYAIGEIILVVIGILIALQISNWNENNKTGQGVKNYLKRLLTEININIDNVNKEIDVELNQISASKKILDMFNQDRIKLESKTIDSLISIIYSTNTISINLGIFTEGINSEKIGKINSEKLRAAIYSLISLVRDVQVQEQIYANDLNDAFGKFIYKNFNYRNMDNSYSIFKGKIGETYFKDYNSLSLLDNMEFENHMDNRFFMDNLQLTQYKKLNSELKRIEKFIREELEK